MNSFSVLPYMDLVLNSEQGVHGYPSANLQKKINLYKDAARQLVEKPSKGASKQKIRSARKKYAEYEQVTVDYILTLALEQQKFIEQGYSFCTTPSSYSSGINTDSEKPVYVGSKPPFDGIVKASGIKQISVTFDKDKKEITIGNYKFSYPQVSFGSENYKYIVYKALESVGYSLPSLHGCPKAYNKITNEFFGRSISLYIRNLNYYMWVSENEFLIKRYCRDLKQLSPQLIYRFNKNKEEIMNAVKNNEENIIPAIMYFGENTNEIKSIVGSKSWKNILKNSPSRNNQIFFLMYYLTVYFEKNDIGCESTDKGMNLYFNGEAHIFEASKEQQRYLLLKLNGLPSTTLRQWSLFNSNWKYNTNIKHIENVLDRVEWISKDCAEKKCLGNKEKIKDISTLLDDTIRMAVEIKKPYSLKWSHRHMKAAHNEYMREYVEKKYGLIEFNFDHKWPEVMELPNVRAVLLETSMSVVKEGMDLKHCVGSYIGKIVDYQSVIYSLTHIPTGERSTLEVSIDRYGKNHKVRQNRGKYNLPVSSNALPSIKMAAVEIEKNLREVQKLDVERKPINYMDEYYF